MLNCLQNYLFEKENETFYLFHHTIISCSLKNIYILNSTHCFIMKIQIIFELQQIAFNYQLEINYYDFLRICKRLTNESYYFLINDTILLSDHSTNFRK